MPKEKFVYSDEKPDENSALSPEEQGFIRTSRGWRKLIPFDPQKEGVHGNSKYTHDMPDKLRDYFDVPYSYKEPIIEVKKNENTKKFEEVIVGYKEIATPLPTFQGFCKMIKVSSRKVLQWRDLYPEFDIAYDEAKDMQFDMWVQNTNKGLYNITFAIYYGKAVMKLYDRPDTTVVKNVNFDANDKLNKLSDDELLALAKKYKVTD